MKTAHLRSMQKALAEISFTPFVYFHVDILTEVPDLVVSRAVFNKMEAQNNVFYPNFFNQNSFRKKTASNRNVLHFAKLILYCWLFYSRQGSL